jgi:hypothetical protein
MTIVVGELHVRLTLIPTPSALQSTCSQHILTNLIYFLSLFLGLRVISRIEVQMGIHGLVQPFPEFLNKLGSSIGHNPLGHSMQTNNPRHIQLC